MSQLQEKFASLGKYTSDLKDYTTRYKVLDETQTRISELENELAIRNRESERDRIEIQRLNTQNKQLNQMVHQLQIQNQSLRQALEKSGVPVPSFDSEDLSVTTVSFFEARYGSEHGKDLQLLQEKLKDSEETIKYQETEIQNLRRYALTLQSTGQDVDTQAIFSDLQNQLSYKDEQILELQRMLRKSEEKSKSTFQKLTSENEKLESLHRTKEEMSDKLRSQNQQEKVEKAERELSRYEREVATLKTKMMSDQLEHERLQVTAKLAIKNAEEEADHYRRRADEAERERVYQVDDLRKQLEMAEEDEKNLRAEMLLLTEKHNTKIVEMEVNYHMLLSQNQNLTSQINRLNTELEVEKERLLLEEEAKRKALRQLEAKITESQHHSYRSQSPVHNEDAVRELNFRIQELEGQLEHLQRRLSSTMESEAFIKEQLDNIHQTKLVLENEVRQLNQQITVLQTEANAEKEALEQQIRRQHDEYDELHHKFLNLQTQKTQLFSEYQEQVKQLNDSLVEKTLEAESYKRYLDQERATIADLRANLAETQAEADRNRSEYLAAEAELATLRRKLHEIEEEAQNVIKRGMMSFQEEKGEMVELFERQQKEIADLEAQNESLKKEIKDLHQTIRTITEERDLHARQHREKSSVLDEAQGHQRKLSADMQAISNDYGKLKKEMEEQAHNTRNQIAQSREELANSEARNKALRKEVADLKQQLGQLIGNSTVTTTSWEQKLMSQQNVVDNQRQEIAELKQALIKTTQQLKEKEAALSDLDIRLKEEQQALERQNREIDRLESQNRDLKSQLSKYDQDIRKQREDRDTASRCANDLEDRMQLLQSSLQRVQLEKRNVEESRDALEQKLRQMQENILQLQREKRELETRLMKEREERDNAERLSSEVEGLRTALTDADRISLSALQTERDDKGKFFDSIFKIASEVGLDVNNIGHIADTASVGSVYQPSTIGRGSPIGLPIPSIGAQHVIVRIEHYNSRCRDSAGRSPVDPEFSSLFYDDTYRDADGRRVGEAFFKPPSSHQGRPHLDAFCYDDYYCDSNGLRAGDKGFVPPLFGITGSRRSTKATGLASGYDGDYVDYAGRRKDQAGFVPPCYGDDYRDLNGKHVGDQGFIPPTHPNKVQLPLESGCYTEKYRDQNGFKPGDRGFTPPLLRNKTANEMATLLPEGYDDNYRDHEGRKRGTKGFQRPSPTGTQGLARVAVLSLVPSNPVVSSESRNLGMEVYDESYRDHNNRRPGDDGFIPPAIGTRGGYGGKTPTQPKPLPAGCYDENYVDLNGRKAGDKGFIPPLIGVPMSKREVKAAGLKSGYDEEYRDNYGRKPGQLGFIPPCYNSQYQDHQGLRIGDHGFIPPAHGVFGTYGDTRPAQQYPLEPGCYDINYRDANGLKPGQQGFIPPLCAKAGKTQEIMASELPEGYDNYYRDVNHRERGETGFRPPTHHVARPVFSIERIVAIADRQEMRPYYDSTYRDVNGLKPGEAGFLPPQLHHESSLQLIPIRLEEGCYDENYVDSNGLKAGDRGFIPPLTGVPSHRRGEKMAGLLRGYDDDYCDANGRRMNQPGFIPPCYGSDYRDTSGLRPGEPGFTPPSHGEKGTCGGIRPANIVPMEYGCYDENYRDSNGRKPGDRGFIPPLAAAQGKIASDMAHENAEGYDNYYRDHQNRRPGDMGFIPPLPTGCQTNYRISSQLRQNFVSLSEVGELPNSRASSRRATMSSPSLAPPLTLNTLNTYTELIIHQIQNLKIKLITTDQLREQLEHSNLELAERLKALRLERDYLLDQVALHQAANDQTRAGLESQYNALLRENSMLKQQNNNQSMIEYNTLQRRIQELQTELLLTKEELQHALNRLDSKEGDIQGLQSLRDEIEKLRELNQELKEANERHTNTLKNQNQAFEAEIEKLRNNYERRMENSDASRAELLAQIARMQEEERIHHQASAQEIHDLLDLNRQKDMCIDKLLLELAAMQELTNDVYQQISRIEQDQARLMQLLRHNKEEFEKEATEIQDEINQLGQERAQLNRQLQLLEAQRGGDAGNVKRQSEELKQLRLTKENLENELRDIKIQKESLQERMRSAVVQIEEQKTIQIQTLESQNFTLQKESESQKQLVGQLRQQIETLKAQRRSLQDDNTQLNEAICLAKKEQEDKVKQLRFEIQKLNTEVKRSESSIQNKDAEIQNIQSKLKHQSQQLQEQMGIIKMLQAEGSSNLNLSGSGGLNSSFSQSTRSPIVKYSPHSITGSPRLGTGSTTPSVIQPQRPSSISALEFADRRVPSPVNSRSSTVTPSFVSPRLPSQGLPSDNDYTSAWMTQSTSKYVSSKITNSTGFQP